MLTILITGSNGQLGLSFKDLVNQYPSCKFLFTTKIDLDITNQHDVNAYFTSNAIDVCVNCAAYTAVDKAEQDMDAAMLSNATAVGYLATACFINKVQFIHISTDYVFDGKNKIPYEETNITNPINYYGITKLNGEKLAQQNCPNSIIIRTAWVYSKYGNNFVKTMQRLMNEKEQIAVVNDQHGIPTNAADLATAIMHIIATKNFVPGVYHYSNEGSTTWFQFASKIASLIKTTCIVNPISSAQFPTPAARPNFSVLNTTKIKHTFKVAIPHWEDSLQRMLT